jgi:hypothetical protein
MVAIVISLIALIAYYQSSTPSENFSSEEQDKSKFANSIVTFVHSNPQSQYSDYVQFLITSRNRWTGLVQKNVFDDIMSLSKTNVLTPSFIVSKM